MSRMCDYLVYAGFKPPTPTLTPRKGAKFNVCEWLQQRQLNPGDELNVLTATGVCAAVKNLSQQDHENFSELDQSRLFFVHETSVFPIAIATNRIDMYLILFYLR